MKDIDPTQPDAAIIEDIPAADEAIRVLLLTRPGEKESEPDYGFPILEVADGRSRSRSGFDRSEVIEAARDAILRCVPGITVQDIEPEMTTTNQVQAVDVGFEIIQSGKTGRVRVELPI
ncbi:GPW/gp25 family protein [Labrys monachus]|uniref:Phage baseplate assembly protein W n=1 Tax=Labrys monachus TaxID=217067 RepID=A0ABU0FKQ7_9HYPH|nr:GPW/gp25 family protein [Labrys monachus]MDQ0394937.1 phage baseplate assembly protein W [Labrys monachus]